MVKTSQQNKHTIVTGVVGYQVRRNLETESVRVSWWRSVPEGSTLRVRRQRSGTGMPCGVEREKCLLR